MVALRMAQVAVDDAIGMIAVRYGSVTAGGVVEVTGGLFA